MLKTAQNIVVESFVNSTELVSVINKFLDNLEARIEDLERRIDRLEQAFKSSGGVSDWRVPAE